MNKDEVIDHLVVECNELVKQLATGNYVRFCSTIVQMVSELGHLKEAMHIDIGNLQANIQVLKDQLRQAGQELEEVSMDGGGA